MAFGVWRAASSQRPVAKARKHTRSYYAATHASVAHADEIEAYACEQHGVIAGSMIEQAKGKRVHTCIHGSRMSFFTQSW
jgi:hypothetical protein